MADSEEGNCLLGARSKKKDKNDNKKDKIEKDSKKKKGKNDKSDEPAGDGTDHMKPRKCTDVLWVLILILGFCGYFYVLNYAWANGKPEELEKIYKQGHSSANQALQSKHGTVFTVQVTEALQAQSILCQAAFIALLLAVGYLFLLKHCAKLLVTIALAILCLVPLAAGSYGFYEIFLNKQYVPLTGSRKKDLGISGAWVLLGFLLCCFVCCSKKAIDVAIACVEVAVNATFDMPSMILAPGFHLLGLAIWMPPMLSGFLYLLSTGNITQPNSQDLAQGAWSGHAGQTLRGAGINFTDEQYALIAYYVLMMLWIIQLCAAISQFVIAYAVIVWYFTPYVDGKKRGVPVGAIFSGYKDAWIYHLGTLSFGSFLVATLSLITMILGLVAKQANETDNFALGCIAKCMGCCVDCFRRFLEFVNKNAYMDVAMNSNNYCAAAKHAIDLMADAAKSVSILNGAMEVVCMAGIGAVAAASAAFAYIMAGNGSEGDPKMIAIIAGVIGGIIALSITNVLDMVADCILFCFVSEIEEEAEHMPGACCGCTGGAKKARQFMHSASSRFMAEKYAPPELRSLVEAGNLGGVSSM